MIADEGLELLDEEECLRLLASSPVGRIAITIGGLPAVFPVNFAVIDGDIVFRTGEGTKLRAALSRAIVGFEVDSIDPTYHEGWSVLVVGRAEELAGTAAASLADSVPVSSWAGGNRQHLVRIAPELVSGRRITRAAI